MPVSTIQEVNIVQAAIFGGYTALQVINPMQQTGYDNWQDAIIIRDTETQNAVSPQPALTNQQFINWHNERESATDQNEADDLTIDTVLSSYNFTKTDAALALQIMAIIANTPSDDASATYQNFIETLQGTSLDIPLRAYAQKDPSVTGFNPNTLTDAEKIVIIDRAVDYLMSGLLVWIGKVLR